MKSLWKKIAAWFKKVFGGGSPEPEPEPPSPPPDPEPEPPQTLPPFAGHSATAWFKSSKTCTMNAGSHSCPIEEFRKVCTLSKENGANAIYLYTANGGDGAWEFTLYKDNVGGELDPAKVASFTARVEEAWKVYGLALVPWLHSDDANRIKINVKDLEAQKRYITDMVRLYDQYAIAYCLGLEVDEYSDKDFTGKLLAHFKTQTHKPVGIHMTNTKKPDWIRDTKADGLFAQYGVNVNTEDGSTKTPAQVEQMTRDCLRQLNGKWIVATEYALDASKPHAKSLGDAGMKGGACATGCGRNK